MCKMKKPPLLVKLSDPLTTSFWKFMTRLRAKNINNLEKACFQATQLLEQESITEHSSTSIVNLHRILFQSMINAQGWPGDCDCDAQEKAEHVKVRTREMDPL